MIPSEKQTKLLPAAKAANYLGITPETLAVWRCTNRYPLPYVKIGRKVMYRQVDLETFIQKGLREPIGGYFA